jgi:hypothetical protein
MAFLWTQHWFALPILIEEPMGDQPIDSDAIYMNDNNQDSSHLSVSKSSPPPLPGVRHPGNGAAPFYSQYSSLPTHQQTNPPRYNQQTGVNHYAQGGGQTQPGAGFDMSAMGGALPNYGTHPFPHSQPQFQQQDQRRLSGASTPAVVYQLQQNVQYPQAGTAFANPGAYSGYGPVQYAVYGPGQISPNMPYSSYSAVQPRQIPGAAPLPQFPQQASPHYYYFPTGYGSTSPAPFPNQTAQMQFGYEGRSNSTSSFGPSAPQDGEGRLSISTAHSGGDDNRKILSFGYMHFCRLIRNRYSTRVLK